MTDESTAVENELRVLDELLREYGKKARAILTQADSISQAMSIRCMLDFTMRLSPSATP